MASLGGDDLGNIRSETNGKTSNLFTQPLPLSDSDKQVILDLFGTTRSVSLTGSKAGTVSVLQTFILLFEGKQGGSQSGETFISTLHPTNKKMYINSFIWTYADVAKTLLNYTMQLMEGA